MWQLFWFKWWVKLPTHLQSLKSLGQKYLCLCGIRNPYEIEKKSSRVLLGLLLFSGWCVESSWGTAELGSPRGVGGSWKSPGSNSPEESNSVRIRLLEGISPHTFRQTIRTHSLTKDTVGCSNPTSRKSLVVPASHPWTSGKSWWLQGPASAPWRENGIKPVVGHWSH